MKKEALLIILLSIFLSVQNANSYYNNEEIQKIEEGDNYKKYLKEAKEISTQSQRNLKKEIPKHHDFKKISDDTLKKINSKEYQDKVSGMLPNINLNQLTAKYESKAEGINQLMVFISSSMPKNTLTQYSIEARKSGAVLVLRGFINNSFKQTISFINSLNKAGTRAIVDPLSYERFAIDSVPQIIVIKDNNDCKFGRCQTTPLHDKVKGNISIKHALELISKEGEFSKIEAKRFLDKLRT